MIIKVLTPPPSTTVHSDMGDSWSQHSLHQRGSQWQLNVTNSVDQHRCNFETDLIIVMINSIWFEMNILTEAIVK